MESVENNMPDFKIKSIIETVELIKKNSSSLVRFGDGEIAIINHKSIPYQKYEPGLESQLKMILETPSNDSCLVLVISFTQIKKFCPLLLMCSYTLKASYPYPQV